MECIPSAPPQNGDGGLKHPGAIFIQLTTACNAKCINCPHPFTYGPRGQHPKGTMEDKVWNKIIRDLQTMGYRNQVGLYLHHEPLLERTLFDKIKQINEETEAFVVISTNGSLLSEKNRNALIASKPRIVHININSAEKDQYEKMTGLSFETTIRQAKRFIAEAAGKIDVEINCPVLPEVDVEKLIGMFPSTRVNTEYWANSRGGLLEGISSRGRGSRFKISDYCLQPEQNFNILFDGCVVLCCNDWAHESKNDFPNVMHESIQNIYSGPLMSRIVDEFRSGDYGRYPMCRHCAVEMGFIDAAKKPFQAGSPRMKEGPSQQKSSKPLSVLLATNHLFGFTGSEITLLTIAKGLRERGHHVSLYAKYIDPRFMGFFNGIAQVHTDVTALSQHQPDAAYVQHQTVALEVRHQFPKLPMVIASLGVLPFLEQPPILDLNVHRYLAISEEVMNNLIRKGISRSAIALFRNIVDSRKFVPKGKLRERPQSALIYSYKMGRDMIATVMAACSALGIHCRHIGEKPGAIHQDDLTDLLNEADIVFTLGRGAIETMMCGKIPIIFDYQGGDGMVTPENIRNLMTCNFSGRLYGRYYSKQELIDEIKQYDPRNGKKLRQMAIELFDAGRGINTLVSHLQDAMHAATGAEQADVREKLESLVQLINITREFTEATARKQNFPTATGSSIAAGFKTREKGGNGPRKASTMDEARLIAIYLPQFHPIPENDRWWGKGFTEWTNVAKATPLFNGHYQPHVPADLGFYDLRVPEVRKAQADLAREHGIHGFCYYHYWFNGKLLLERPIQDVLKSGEPDFPFCLCWANENWTRRWDGGDHEILMEQKYSEQDDRDHIRYLAEYFRDPRYIRVDGKPLFLVYRANRMPDPSKTTRIWREEARRLGIGELYLCRVESFPDEHTDPAASGFDAAVEFQPDWTQVGPPVHHLADNDCRIYRYGDVAQRMMEKAAPPYKRFPCVTPRWDNSPRWKRGATIFVDSTPELYERWLRATLETFKPASPEENFVFLNAWNEWGEGNHLEPDARFGRGYLEATRRALDAVRRSEQDTAAEAHAGILRTLIAAGKRAEAVPALERLVESWPDYAPAHNDLGVLFYESGNGDKALACYEKAVTLAPENPMFRKNLADFYFVTEGRVEEALELYRKVLAQRPDDVETLIALGQLCARIERIDDSICFFRRVLELDSHNSEVRELYDKLLLLKKSLDEPPMANTDDHLQPDKQMHDYVCTIQAGQEKAGVTGTLHLNVLLTNHHLTDFTGSEVFTFTIADFLKKKGHRVTVLSKYVDNSLRRYFNRIGVTVVQDIATLIGESFDVAHIHHNVMAMEVRRHFKDLPLVFLSHGVIPFLEQNPPVDIGVSRYLAVSEEVHENLIQHGVDSNRLEIFRNIVDSDKFSPRAALSAHPARALILSNKLDPATERTIREACSRLDIVATFAGMRFGVAHQDYLPEMINQADIVFTLGRGVIETMMCGRVPIVLDHRGGDGMVTPDNVEHLMKRNFSGRTHRRMYNTDELMREIARYEPSFGDSLRRMALDRFDADKNIGRLIDVYKEAMSLDIPHLEESTCNQIDAFLATVDTTRHFSQIEASRAIRSTVETNPEKPVADKVDTFLSERLKKLRTQPGEFTKGLDTTPLSDQTYDILIPIFNAFEHLQRCIDSVIRHTHGNHAIYLLDDCSTDSRVLPLLESFEKADPRVRLIESSINRGFVHNVNRGFELSENDVVILNSDTEVTEGWLARMHRCLHSHPDIGIVCPLSNNATILSVPVMNKCNSLPEGMSPNDFAALVAKVSRADYPEIPTGVGFCMLISRDTLKRTGFFDPAFGLGYGEENDLCMKARAAGKKIVCCDDAYVHHYGEASFCRIDRIDDKRKLNEMLLSKKWPNYSKEIYTFCCVNPLREVQERILATIKDYESPVLPEVLHVMHNFDAPGGTELHTRNIIDGLAEQLRSTVIYPASLPDQWVDLAAKEVNGYLRVLKLRKESIAVNDSFLELYGDLTNPFVETVFSNILRGGRYSIVHFQHLGGWSSLLLPLIAKDQGCKVVISLHDYYLLCPEYNLILPNLRRCGKYIPDGEDSECLYCLGTKRKYHGAGKPSLLQDYLDHRKLIVKRVFEAADMLIAPSNFVRDRFIQAYQEEVKDKIVTVPHGIEHLDKSKRSKRGHALRVGFLGNASDRKGVFTLLQAARILKGKPIQFEIFGGAPPSLTKMASELGIIQHGFYNRSDLPRLLAKTHLVMIPSVWDETFCLTASESQMMGIPVIASDCGAISERIVDGKTGFLVTPGDAKALAARLLEILDNPSLLEEVTANLRDHHIKTMRENIEDYARIYDRLLGIPARHDSEVHPHPMPIPSGRNLTSIVILTFNELEYTKRCVESIRRHTPEPYEIIFVDNGSKDGTIKWLRELVKQNSHVKLIENGRNLGFAKGCNQGIEAAAGEFILLLNNDTVVTEGWLAGMLECLHRMPDAGIVGPMTNQISGIQKVETVDYDSIEGLDDYARTFRQKNRHRCIKARRVVGFCMLFRKDLVDKIGPLDESFGTGNFEDDDFCVRAALAGYRNVIAGDVFIHHFGSRSFIGNRIDYGTALAGNRKIYTDKWQAFERKVEEGGKIRSLVARERAQEQFLRGDVQGAVDLWLAAIRHLPGDHRAYHEMADGLIRAKRFRDALDVLNEVPAGPASAERLVLEGRCREGLDELDAAEKMAVEALSARADSPSALNLRGVVAFRRGAAGEARSFFGKASEADPSWGEPVTNLGVLTWADGRHGEAFNLLEKGFILTPCDSDLAERYHAAASSLGLQARAEKAFREARSLYPASRTIAFLLIDLLIAQEKHAEAMAEIEAAMAAFEVDGGFIDAALEVRRRLGPMAIGDKTPGPTLSLCMIVRNEQSNLVRCLSSVKAAVDEIVVVDTGSTDRTKDLAAVFGARVFDFAWTDDFSSARNESLARAKGDWILVLDADETLSPADHRKLRELIRKSPKRTGGYDLATRNYVIEANTAGWTANDGSYPGEEAGTGWYANRKVRLFRNDPRIRFSGAVHELVEASMLEAGMKIAACDIPVHHTGKLDRARVTEKGERYFELGMKKIEETGGTPRAVLELAVQAGELGRWDDAVDLWRRFLGGNPGGEAVRAYVNLINACLNADRFDEALAEARKAEMLANGTRELLLNCAAAEFFAGDLRKAAATAQRLLRKHPDYPPALGLLAMSFALTGQEERSLECMQRLQERGLDTRAQLLPAVAKLRIAEKDEQADRLQELIGRHTSQAEGRPGPAPGRQPGERCSPTA